MAVDPKVFAVFAEPNVQKVLLYAVKHPILTPFSVSGSHNISVEAASSALDTLKTIRLVEPSGLSSGIMPTYRLTAEGFQIAEQLRRVS